MKYSKTIAFAIVTLLFLSVNVCSQEHGEHKGEMIKHDPKNNTMLLMGEGEMTYHCPMTEDKVFASEPGKCTVCGMNLKKMSETDKNRMEKLLKTQEVIRIKKIGDIKTEKHKH